MFSVVHFRALDGYCTHLTVSRDDLDPKMISRNMSTPSTSCKNIATS